MYIRHGAFSLVHVHVNVLYKGSFIQFVVIKNYHVPVSFFLNLLAPEPALTGCVKSTPNVCASCKKKHSIA